MLRTIRKLLGEKSNQIKFPIALMGADAVLSIVLYVVLYMTVLSPTTEKKRFCQTSAKEKRCNSKKIATLSKSCSVLSRTFLFALFFDFGNLLCRCGYNPYACIAHTVKKRVKLPPLRVLLRRRF